MAFLKGAAPLAYVRWKPETRELSIEPITAEPYVVGIANIQDRLFNLTKPLRVAKIKQPPPGAVLEGRWDDVRGALVFKVPEAE